MTIEKLEQGNIINCQLKRLRYFKSKCVLQEIEIISGDAELFINEYPDIIELIQSCISDKIIELENQLKEL